MAIRSRFGGECTVVRQATVADVKEFDNRKPDKEDRERTRDGWRCIMRYVEGNHTRQEFLADIAYLRADGGFAEIHAAFKAVGAGQPDVLSVVA